MHRQQQPGNNLGDDSAEREREKGKVEGRQGGVIWERSEGPRSSHI